ncbi:MAG: SDR family NAD(P)-dependent oxidoreductase, partial [Halomonas sp.]
MSSTVVITGANRGVGLALAEQYHQAGWWVIGVCRESSEALQAAAGRVIEGIDITQPESVAALANALQDETVDLLINNAGLLRDEALGSVDFDSIREQMEINAYAPLRVVEALLPTLKKGSKIANITSRMGSIADNDSGGRYGYRASKAALNAFGKSLAMDLKPQG